MYTKSIPRVNQCALPYLEIFKIGNLQHVTVLRTTDVLWACLHGDCKFAMPVSYETNTHVSICIVSTFLVACAMCSMLG